LCFFYYLYIYMFFCSSIVASMSFASRCTSFTSFTFRPTNKAFKAPITCFFSSCSCTAFHFYRLLPQNFPTVPFAFSGTLFHSEVAFRKRKETQLVILESEAALLRMIFEKYASGKGIKAIANELNQFGYKTKCGEPFSVVAVKDILNIPFYVGRIRFNKHEN